MAEAVKDAIGRARDGKTASEKCAAACLLANSLDQDPSQWPNMGKAATGPVWQGVDFPESSFGSWSLTRGQELGGARCHAIGCGVAKKMGFTSAEARSIAAQTKAEAEAQADRRRR